MVSSCYCHTWG